MRALCYESHPLGAITRRPRLAMDAALPNANSASAQPTGLIGDDTMKQVLELLSSKLDPATFAKVKEIIVANSKMAADDEPPPLPKKRYNPETIERAMDFLRSRGIGEDDIDWIRKTYGVEKPTIAQDSARREQNERAFRKRFPTTANIVGEPISTRREKSALADVDLAAYFTRFPDARRIR
jgi:hypothetical protein